MTAPRLPVESPAAPLAATTAELDASCRWPVTMLLWKALGWLALGTLLLLITSIKLHGPGFLADAAWLTLGRVRPAAMNALVYGFACQAALALAVWLVCRLGRVRLEGGPAILTACVAWNAAVFLGVLAILAGGSTGFEWLEMPAFVGPWLFVAWVAIAGWTLVTLARRADKTLYVSLWYVLALLFVFPWIFSAAHLLLHWRPVRGVMQAVVAAWYRGNLLELGLNSAGLAAVFYFLPKLLGRPLFSDGLAKFGFWTLVLFGSWTGLTQLLGGPIPAWMLSASIAANGVLLVALLAVGMNWYGTWRGAEGWRLAWRDTTLRYILFGAACYLVASLEGVLIGTRSVSVVTRFTYMETARVLLLLLGFLGMTTLGAMHYLVPRLLGAPWPSDKLARVNFLSSAVGSTLVFMGLTAAGLIQGFKLNDPSVPVVDAIKATVPCLGLATLGFLALLVGQAALLLNFGRLLVRVLAPSVRQTVAALRSTEGPVVEVKA